jgi:ribosome-associated translation inhibitor RaiA
MESSDAVIARLHQEMDKLEKYFDRLTSCHVIVEAPRRPYHPGEPFRIHITLGVPGKDLVVAHEPAWRAAAVGGSDAHLRKHEEVAVPHKDLYVAIRDGFDAMRRQLQDYVHCLRHEVKTHLSSEALGG